MFSWNISDRSHGAEAKGNFTNPSHTDPDELAFRALLPNTTQDLTILASICEATNGDNLKYVGTVSTVRDMVALHDAIEGTGSRINYWGIRWVGIHDEADWWHEIGTTNHPDIYSW